MMADRPKQSSNSPSDFPTGTLRTDNAIMTSKRRRFVVITALLLRPVSDGFKSLIDLLL